jgi:hypothetical protein
MIYLPLPTCLYKFGVIWGATTNERGHLREHGKNCNIETLRQLICAIFQQYFLTLAFRLNTYLEKNATLNTRADEKKNTNEHRESSRPWGQPWVTTAFDTIPRRMSATATQLNQSIARLRVDFRQPQPMDIGVAEVERQYRP